MSEAALRAKFIEAANALAASQEGRFTLNDVYTVANLTKRDFRRAFKNKSDLIEAASRTNIAALNGNRPDIVHCKDPEETWIERRFRVLERAMFSLETQLDLLRHAGKPNARSSTSEAEQTSPPCPDLAAPDKSGVGAPYEAPPIVTDLDSRSEPQAMASGNSPDAENSRGFDGPGGKHADLESLWTIADEPHDPKSYNTILTVAVAIACGILVGILTSAVHAGANGIGDQKKAIPVIDGRKPSVQTLLDRATGGDAIAASKLAVAYAKGAEVEPDTGNAIRWAEVAASHGNSDAEYLLGSMLQEGIKPDPSRAVRWYFQAAKQGNLKAMHNLGIAFMMGTGVAKDSATAAQWFARAANLGYRDSQFDLAVLYERGDGVPQNSSIALRWYEQAASSGDVEAAKRVSWLRENVTTVMTIQ